MHKIWREDSSIYLKLSEAAEPLKVSPPSNILKTATLHFLGKIQQLPFLFCFQEMKTGMKPHQNQWRFTFSFVFFRFLLFLQSSDLSLGVEYCQETIEVEICQYCSSAGGNCARKRRQGHSQGSTTPRGAQGSTP